MIDTGITRRSSRPARFAMLVGTVLIVAAAMPATAQKLGGQLNYLGWEGYDEPEAFKPMTDQGVVFNRTYIGNNDELIAKLRAGGAGTYDVGNINWVRLFCVGQHVDGLVSI